MRTRLARCTWERAQEQLLHPAESGNRPECAGPHWRGRPSVSGECGSNQSLLSRSDPN